MKFTFRKKYYKKKTNFLFCSGYGLSEVSGAHTAQYPIMCQEDLAEFEVGSAGTF